MTDTARLRELVDLFDRCDTHHMEIYAPAGDPSLGLSTEHIRSVVAEVDKMRAVVEAARAACAAGQEWQKDGGDRKAKTERLIKTNKELDQAVAAMEQNDE